MCNFSFIKFSQKLGVLDLQNLVGALREPMLLNKVLCIPCMCPRVVDVTLPRKARPPARAHVPLLSTSHICPLRPFPIYFFSTTIVPALLVSMSTRSANREELIGLAAGHRSVRAPRRACPRSSVARPTAQCSWPKPNGSNPLCLLWSPQWQQCVQWCYTFGSAAQ